MLVELINPIVAGLVAGLVSYVLWKKKFTMEFKTGKTAEFLERQLSEFYGPMVVCIKQVRSIGELHLEGFNMFDRHGRPESEEDSRKHAELIDKHNIEYREIVLPLWERMLELFSNKGHLTEPNILDGFDQFFRFVKEWRDHLEKPIGQRFPLQAAGELAEKYREPVDLYELIESQ
ncbi:MAG: hypothetical protein RX316_06450 [bacterium]|nr:hypothetical protein [bacterium]